MSEKIIKTSYESPIVFDKVRNHVSVRRDLSKPRVFEHNYFTVRKTLHSLVQYYTVRNF